MFDVVVVGSANLDLVATTGRLPLPGETVVGNRYEEHAGGKGLNQAVAAARSGAHVAFVGAFGDDSAGHELRDVAQSNGIDVSAARTCVDEPTGRALVTVDADGENSIVVVPGANATVVVDADTFMTSTPARVALAQLEVPTGAIGTALSAAHAAGARTVLNPAPVPPNGLGPELLRVCDIVVPNEHELELLGGVDRLLDSGVGTVVVTMGAGGVLVVDADSRNRWRVDAHHVDVVDTTGAGDAFCGALAARVAAGDPLDSAVRYATAAGALATTVAGAVPSLPHRAAINALLGSH